MWFTSKKPPPYATATTDRQPSPHGREKMTSEKKLHISQLSASSGPGNRKTSLGKYVIYAQAWVLSVLSHDQCQYQWRKRVLVNVHFPNTQWPQSLRSLDKSKNQGPLRNCIIPNSAITRAPGTIQSEATCFLGPDGCLVANYVISQWVLVLAIGYNLSEIYITHLIALVSQSGKRTIFFQDKCQTYQKLCPYNPDKETLQWPMLKKPCFTKAGGFPK